MRSRWGIENSGHYVLDVVFGEDESHTHSDHGPANLSLFRRVCMNLVHVAPGVQGSLTSRIKRAGWNPSFLYGLLETELPDVDEPIPKEESVTLFTIIDALALAP